MKSIVLTACLLLSVMASTPAFGQSAEAQRSLSGSWHLTGDIMGNPIDLKCALEQAESTLSGTCRQGEVDVDITGDVSGDLFSFNYDSDYQGEKLTLIYSGRHSNPDSLQGTLTVEPYGVEGNFSAVPSENAE